ncbi:MAG: wapA7, partial [Verrucomicrobiales bacterium]|nr:wapA7 [Verrucomicrobiales bacterium]
TKGTPSYPVDSEAVYITVQSGGGGTDYAKPVAKLMFADEVSLKPVRLADGSDKVPVILNGTTVLHGEAFQSATLAPDFNYYIEVYKASDGEFTDPLFKTSPPKSMPVASVPAPGTAGVLDALDLTRLPNGSYDLRLVVTGGGWLVDDWARVNLDTQLRMGRFTFSESDVLTSGDIPLSITRNYDSYNPNHGDFGYSWTFSIADLDFQLDEERQETEAVDADGDSTGGTFSMRVGGGRDVTLTLPDDGRRVTFAFEPVAWKCNDSDDLGMCVKANWVAPEGVTATLRLSHDAVYSDGGWSGIPMWNGNGSINPDNYEFGEYVLTLEDGTQYFIEREATGTHDFDSGTAWGNYAETYDTKARVREIHKLSGDIIVINKPIVDADGRTQFSIENIRPDGNKTASILICRDLEGRIEYVFDQKALAKGLYSDGKPKGLPTIQYVYDAATGNLKEVRKLVDAKDALNPKYEATTYSYYDNADYSHYIKEIHDPRGMSPLISHYDDQGRMNGVTDGEGHKTTFIFDGLSLSGLAPTAVKVEKTIDHWGHESLQEADAHGNVVLKINALHQKTRNSYDGRDQIVREELLDVDNTLLSRTDHEYVYHEGSQIVRELRVKKAKVTDGVPVEGADQITTTVFNEHGQFTRSIDSDGTYMKNSYTSLGEIEATEKWDSKGTSDETDDVKLQTIVQNSYYSGAPFDGLLEWARDASGTKKIYHYYDGQQSESGYAFGRTSIEEQRDKDEKLLSLLIKTYDANGNVLTESRARNSESDLAVTLSEYDAMGRVIRSVDAEGGETLTDYGLSSLVKSSKDRYGNRTSYLYNKLGELIKTTHPNNAIECNATQYGYSLGNGRLGRATIDEDPHFVGSTVYGTRTIYDEEGREVRIERLQNIVITVSDINVDKEVYESTFQSADVVSSTEKRYDDAGRQTHEVDAEGNVTVFGYDDYGRRNLVKNWINRPQGRFRTESVTIFDGNENLQTTTIIETPVDSADVPVSGGQVQTANTQSYSYDRLKHRWLTAFQDGTYSRNIFDDMGHVIEKIDQDGVATKYEYDGLGRVITVIKAYKVYSPQDLADYNAPDVIDSNPADKTVTRYSYNLAGSRISQTDANQTINETPLLTLFEYDKLGRPTKRKLPNGQEEKWEYDTVVGTTRVNRVTHTDFNGTLIVHNLDTMGRVVLKTSDGQTPVEILYTATGQRTSMTDASGLTEYQYDNHDRLWKKTVEKGGAEERTLTYLYYKNYKIKSITSSTGNTSLAYAYDGVGRLSSANSSTYQYDTAGNLGSVSYPNGVTATYGYTTANRLTDVEIAKIATLAHFNYDPSGEPSRRLGRAGHRKAAREVINTTGGNLKRNVDYDYDRLYRLTKESVTIATGNTLSGVPTGDVTYDDSPGYSDTAGHGYDRVGNRRSRDSSLAGVSTYSSHSFDVNDRELATDFVYSYDANGNTLVGKLPSSSGVILPTSSTKDKYDYENCLIERSDGNTTIRLVYDGDGNRVRKIVTVGTGTPTTTRYLVDDRNPTGYSQVLEEWKSIGNAASTLGRSYVYGNDLISQKQNDGTLHYYGYDGHGNVRALINASGQVTDSYSYDAFGLLIHQWHLNAETPNRYLYCGEQWDSDLGMYFLRARYLSPESGRFWTMDTYDGEVQEPLSLHKYLYAHSDPVDNLDPSGNWSLTEQLAVCAKQAGLLSMRLAKYKRALDKAYQPFVNALIVANISLACADDDISWAAYPAIAYNFELMYEFNKNVKKGMKYTTVEKAKRLMAFVKGRIEDISEAHATGVTTKVTGFPDFSPYVHPLYGNCFIFYTGKRGSDFQRADLVSGRAFVKMLDFGQKWTWHHHELVGLMQLVPTAKHRRGHSGGGLIYDICKDTDGYGTTKK